MRSSSHSGNDCYKLGSGHSIRRNKMEAVSVYWGFEDQKSWNRSRYKTLAYSKALSAASLRTHCSFERQIHLYPLWFQVYYLHQPPTSHMPGYSRYHLLNQPKISNQIAHPNKTIHIFISYPIESVSRLMLVRGVDLGRLLVCHLSKCVIPRQILQIKSQLSISYPYPPPRIICVQRSRRWPPEIIVCYNMHLPFFFVVAWKLALTIVWRWRV